MTLGDSLIAMCEVCCCRKKMSPDTVIREFKLILLEKETGKNFGNYNKTRINKGHQHSCWMELKEVLRVYKM